MQFWDFKGQTNRQTDEEKYWRLNRHRLLCIIDNVKKNLPHDTSRIPTGQCQYNPNQDLSKKENIRCRDIKG